MKDLRLAGNVSRFCIFCVFAFALAAGILLVFTGVIYAQDISSTTEASKFWQKQQQEDTAFRESLKGMTPEQRKTAMAAQNQKRESEQKASMAKRHADDMALLKQDLDKNKNLSDADKKKQMDSADKRYKEDAAFRESLKGMTPEQSKAAIAAQDQKRESEQKASMAKRHADDMALLKQDLDKNKNLSDADKKKQMDAAEKQYQDNIAFWESLKGMTPEQRTKAIDERFKKR